MQWLEINRQFKCWTPHCSLSSSFSLHCSLSHHCVSSLALLSHRHSHTQSHTLLCGVSPDRIRWNRGQGQHAGGQKKNVWDREEIRQDKNREGQRASRKHRPILQMTHVWIILVLLFLLFNDKFTTPRESKRSRYRCPNCIINVSRSL